MTLDQPGVSLMVPADGRLAGYGFLTDVTGAAFAQHAGEASDAVQASSGDQLVVVAATENDLDQSFYYDYGNSAPTYQLVSGQLKVDLTTSAIGGSPASYVWAVSIPAGAPASLVATNGGFSQSFDLRAGRRTGPSPVALYRDSTSPAATESLSATQTLRGTGSGDDPAQLTTAPTEAVLGYFQPNDTLVPPPALGTALFTLSTLERVGPRRITELAAIEGVAQPSMTALVTNLERAGLVERWADSSDGRVTLVALTDLGTAYVRDRRRESAAALEHLIEKLDDEERAVLKSAVPALTHLTQLDEEERDPSHARG